MSGQRYEPRRTPNVRRTPIDDPPRRTRVAPPPSERRFKPQPARVYKRRRWGAFILVLFLVLLYIRACVPSEHDREMKAWQEQAERYTSPVAEAPVAPDEVEGTVEKSRPLEMAIPSLGLRANFEDGTCRFKDGAIDPESLGDACVFTAENKPYELPGTDSGDIVVIAGHAAAGVPAVFDKLYDAAGEKHTIAPGDTLYVRTEASGENWLKYQATDLHEPEKEGLSQSAEIWGDGPMPGRLLTITCVQPANPFQDSVRNAVIGWQLQGVVDQEEVRKS